MQMTIDELVATNDTLTTIVQACKHRIKQLETEGPLKSGYVELRDRCNRFIREGLDGEITAEIVISRLQFLDYHWGKDLGKPEKEKDDTE